MSTKKSTRRPFEDTLVLDPHIYGPYPLPAVPAGREVEVRWRSREGTVHFVQLRDHGQSWGIDRRGDIIDVLQAVQPPPDPSAPPKLAIEVGDVWLFESKVDGYGQPVTDGTTRTFLVEVYSMRWHGTDGGLSLSTRWALMGSRPTPPTPRFMWVDQFERERPRFLGNVRPPEMR